MEEGQGDAAGTGPTGGTTGAAGSGRGALAAGVAAIAGLVALAAWLLARALDATLPLGVHGFDLWLATLPAWVAAGVALALVGEGATGARLQLGRLALLLFALLSPPASGAVCGALRAYQTARLSFAFRDHAVAVPASVTAVRWRIRTVEQERPRRSVEVRTPYLAIAYRFEGPRELEVKTDEDTASRYAAALVERRGVERDGVPYPEVAWVLPDAPDRAVLAPADERPSYPVSGAVPAVLCLALTVALVVGYVRNRPRA